MSGALWALQHWRLILSAIGFAILGIMLASAKAESLHWQKQSAQYEGLYKSEVLALAATKANYLAATEKARADDQANARRAEQQQASITQEVSSDYQTKLADLRARYDALRVRAGSAPANPGSGGTAGLPEASNASPGPDDASPVDPFACEANTLQLGALIDWVTRQSAVPIDSP